MQNPPPGIQRTTVRIAYEDPQAAVDFLEQAFGFPERTDHRLEGPQGKLIVTAVAIGDTYVMIGPAGSHGLVSPASVGSSTESLMVYVDDIDTHYANAMANGAEIISPPADQYWGDRRYEAKDLEGHLWFFHERTKEISAEEIAKVEAGFRGD